MQQHNPSPNGDQQPVAIGIDFGTSKCCVAAVRGGRVHVLENEFGQRTTPSWVAFNSQQRLVGGAALDQAVVNCANTVSAVKRTLGRTYDQVKGLPSSCRIGKCGTNDKLQYSVGYRRRQRQLSPEQITAMMLAKMKDIAEASLGCPVYKAVISVPASYGIAQRAAVINAGKVAGLEVLQLINETTAAGIAFQDNRTVKTPVTIAVVDFGAGKLDISIMKCEEKSIRVIAASGSPYLGGCNIDEVLVNHCVSVIKQKHCNVKISDKALVKLRLACEKAKRTLSLLPDAQVSIDSLDGDLDVKIPVHRRDICNLFDDEIRRTIVDIFERLFKEKSLGKDSIEKVVLVGGSTRIPAVKSILEEYFGPHKLDQTVNQDEAVAQGAALRAAALSGAVPIIEVSDVASFDICYTRRRELKVERIINKFSPLPSVKKQNFNEVRGTKLQFFERMYCFNQSSSDVQLLSVIFSGSILDRGSFVNADLDQSLDVSGMFSISIPSKGFLSSLEIKPIDFHPPDPTSIWIKEEKEFQRETDAEVKRVDSEVELESLCFELQKALSNQEVTEYCSQRELESCRNSLSNAMDWISNNIEGATLGDISHKITKLNNVRQNVKGMMDAAQKKATRAKEEAARKEAEMEKLRSQMSAFESLLCEVTCALGDPNLVMYSHPQNLDQCKSALSVAKAWKENIESPSLTEISRKFDELTELKKMVDELKAEAAREKARQEEEATRKEAEMENLRCQMFAFESLLCEVTCALGDPNLVTYLNPHILEQCKFAVSDLEAWKKNRNIESLTLIEISQKFDELNQFKNKVDQWNAEAAREKARIEEETAKKREEMEMLKCKSSAFKSLLPEVTRLLEDISLVGCTYSSKFESFKSALRGFVVWKENLMTATLTRVSQKLDELNKLKSDIEQLKAEDAREKARLDEEAAKKRADLDMFSSEISAVETLFSEVTRSLENASRVRRSHRSELESCKDTLSSLAVFKVNIESASMTEVSQKSEELTQLKTKLEDLKEDVANQNSLVEEHFSKNTLVQPSKQPTRSRNASDNFTANRCTRNIALNAINGIKKQAENDNECSSNSNKSSSGYVSSMNGTRASPNEPECEVLSSSSGSRPPTEQRERRSSSSSRRTSTGMAPDDSVRSQFGQTSDRDHSQHRRSEDMKNEPFSTSLSRQNSGDEQTKRRSGSRPRKETADEHGEENRSSRSRLLSENTHVVVHRSRTSHYSAEMREVEHDRQRSSSLSRPPSECYHTVHRSRALHNSDQNEEKERVHNEKRSSSRFRRPSENECKELRSGTPKNCEENDRELRVHNRDRSSSRVRHSSINSKEHRSTGTASSLEGDRHVHQSRFPNDGMTTEGVFPQQPGLRDGNASQQRLVGRDSGSPLVDMRKTAVVNSATLPSKHAPMIGLHRENGRSDDRKGSKKVQTCTTSVSTQTDVAVSGNSCSFGNGTSASIELKSQAETELVEDFRDWHIYLPCLEIVKNAKSNDIVNCKRCAGLGFFCSLHSSEGYKEFGKIINSLPTLINNSQTGSKKINFNMQSSLEPLHGTTESEASTFHDHKEPGPSNGGVGSPKGSTPAVSCQSNAVPNSRASVDGLSSAPATPAWSTRPNQAYSPVYTQRSLTPTDIYKNCVVAGFRGHSQRKGDNVQKMCEKFDNMHL